MGGYSYSQPSLTPTSLDYGSQGEHGFGRTNNFEVNSVPEKAGPGIPWRCFCGLGTITMTSTTEKNPGRVFYGCKDSMDGGHHLFKWLDEALMDEIKEIRSATTSQGEFIRRMQDWYHCQEFPDIVNLEKELAEVKALLIQNRSAMNLLKKMKEWKHVSIACLIGTSVVLYYVCKIY